MKRFGFATLLVFDLVLFAPLLLRGRVLTSHEFVRAHHPWRETERGSPGSGEPAPRGPRRVRGDDARSISRLPPRVLLESVGLLRRDRTVPPRSGISLPVRRPARRSLFRRRASRPGSSSSSSISRSSRRTSGSGAGASRTSRPRPARRRGRFRPRRQSGGSGCRRRSRSPTRCCSWRWTAPSRRNGRRARCCSRRHRSSSAFPAGSRTGFSTGRLPRVCTSSSGPRASAPGPGARWSGSLPPARSRSPSSAPRSSRRPVSWRRPASTKRVSAWGPRTLCPSGTCASTFCRSTRGRRAAPTTGGSAGFRETTTWRPPSGSASSRAFWPRWESSPGAGGLSLRGPSRSRRSSPFRSTAAAGPCARRGLSRSRASRSSRVPRSSSFWPSPFWSRAAWRRSSGSRSRASSAGWRSNLRRSRSRSRSPSSSSTSYSVSRPSDAVFRETPGIARLRELERASPGRFAAAGWTLPPNVAEVFSLEDARGHLLHEAAYRRLLSAADPNSYGAFGTYLLFHPRSLDPASPVLDLLNVKTLAAPPGAHLPVGNEVDRRDAAAMNSVDPRTLRPSPDPARFPRIYSGPDLTLFARPSAFAAVPAGRPGTARRSRGGPRRRPADARDRRLRPAGRQPASRVGRIPPRVRRDDPRRRARTRAVRALDADGANFTSGQFSEELFALLAALSGRGADAAGFVANGIFLGLELPAGHHRVEGRFRIPALELLISVVGLIGLAAIMGKALSARRPG